MGFTVPADELEVEAPSFTVPTDELEPVSAFTVPDDEAAPSGSADGFFGQVWQKLATGTRQAFAGAKTTLGAATGADSWTSGGLADLATADRRAAAERTPADLAFESDMAQNAAEFNAAPGALAKAREFVDYAAIAARNPSAAIQMGAQSIPNTLISIPAALVGRAAGATLGAAAGVETGPGLLATGVAGAAAGDVGANILMEAGPAIYQQVLKATEGKAVNWTPDQFAAFLETNPDVVTQGLKSGATRGSVIGLVDVAGMGMAGRVMGKGAAAASRPALLARGAAATGIETAAEGGGEALAGIVDTGQIDSAAVAQEMIGGTLTGVPTALAGKALNGARGTPAEGRLVFDDEVQPAPGLPLNLAQIAARGGQVDATEIPPGPAPSEAATQRETAPIPSAPPIQRAPTPEIQPPDAFISAPANGATAPNASAPTPLPVLNLRPEPGSILAPAQPGLPADQPTADDATLRDTAPPTDLQPQEQSASRAGLAPEAFATPTTPPPLPPTSQSQAQAPDQPRPEAERVKMSKPGVGEQVNLWRAIADDPNAFQLGPEPRVKTPTEIAKAYSNPQHQLEITEVEPSQDRIAKEWDIKLNTGGTAKMMKGTDGTVWLNTAALESNREIAGGGAPVYQFAATYAHNNGLKFRADPAGLSNIAKLRRIDQMVSSALRHGTTAHLDPTAMQDDGSTEMSSWIPGNNDQNLGALLRLQADNVHRVGRELGIDLDDLTLDPETNTIRHDPTGQTLTQGDFKSLLGRFHSSDYGVGETTLLRALITRSQMGAQRSGRGGAWHDNLLSLLARGGSTGRPNQRLPGAIRRGLGNPSAGGFSSSPRVAGDVSRATEPLASDGEVFRAINLSRKPLLYSHPAGTPGRLTAGQRTRRWNAAQAALDRLERVAPELAGRVKLVTNRTKLRASDFHPEDWSSLASSEGFFDPRTGDIVILTDQVEVRKGETTLQAIQRVALHEAIGHSGLQALRQNANPALVKRWNGLMESIENDPVISAEIAAIGEQPGYEHLSEDPDGLVEEWFARQVETFTEADLNQMPVTTPLGKLWLWLKDSLVWISRGFDKSVWTQAEVRELMQLSRQALRDGGPRGVSGERVRLNVDAAANATPPQVVTIPQIQISRHPDGMIAGMREWIKGAKADLTARLRANTGLNTGIDWDKLRQFKQGENPLHHFQAVAALPELYANSKVATTEADKRGGNEVTYEKRYAWAVFPDGKRRHVLITGKLYRDAKTPPGVYSLEALEVEVREAPLTYTARPTRETERAFDQGAQPLQASESMDAFVAGIKPEHRGGRLKQSQGLNPFHASDAPPLLRRALRLPSKSPFRVKGQIFRALLYGNALPKELRPAAAQSQRDIDAIQEVATQISKDWLTAIDSYAKRTGKDLRSVHELVAMAMENPVLLQSLPDPVLKERTRKARNFMDEHSYTTAAYTGGQLGQTILQNRGHWMRRMYACFDPAANWTYDTLTAAAKKGQQIAGVDAAKILRDAAAYITTTTNAQRRAAGEPPVKPGEVAAMMKELTDRRLWEATLVSDGSGPKVSKDVTSLMRRADYHPDVKTWMRQHNLSQWDYMTVHAQAQTGGQYEGRNATALLSGARAYLTARHPKASIGEINDMLRLQDIPAPLRALMGEEKNPIKRFMGSVRFQSQFIARHEQQKAMRDIGLAAGLFSEEKTDDYHVELGDGRERNGFKLPVTQTVNGQPVTVEKTLYTTPELMTALGSMKGAFDPISGGQNFFVRMVMGANREAKLNKIALNPYGWVTNGVLGNFFMLLGNGDLASLHAFSRILEAVQVDGTGKAANRGDVINAVTEQRRDYLRKLRTEYTSMGIMESGVQMQDLEASLDAGLLQVVEEVNLLDRVKGGIRGAAYGYSGGLTGIVAGGAVGAAVGNQRTVKALHSLADFVMGKPDRIAKIVSYQTNFAAHIAAGMTPEQARQLAVEKTLNTMPNYGAVWEPIRRLSRIGFGIGATVSFVHEMHRNTYWNMRYMAQELKSGNGALMERGLQRLVGIAAVIAIVQYGLPALFHGLFGGADEEDERGKLWKQNLGKPWEKFASLVFTKINPEEATFINQSYLVPHLSMLEVARAAINGRDFAEAMQNGRDAFMSQWLGGGIASNAFLRAWTNEQPNGQRVSKAPDGTRENRQERFGYIMAAAFTPGIIEMTKHLAWATEGKEHFGRTYSFEEVALNLAGFRFKTYTTESRVRGRFYALRDATNASADWAKEQIKGGADPAAVHERANAWRAAFQNELDELQVGLKTLNVSPKLIRELLSNTGLKKGIVPLK